jgi:DNA helicase II / ATP-dependent DNA helicase PcrA
MKEFEELNPPQLEAVQHKEGPLLVLAGAGAGKTKVITLRIFNLVKSGVSPREILAITFTNKAAKEMRERVFSLLGNNSSSGYQNFNDDRPFVSTFHSLGVNILRENYEILGLSKYFTIYDRADSVRITKEVLKDLGYDPKQYSPGKIHSIISKMKGDFIGREEYTESSENNFFGKIVGMVWDKYESVLKKEKALDFGDLLLKTANLLSENEKIREYYQRRWKYLHIDEYQDTNKVQYTIANLIALKHKNIFVVGDVDQNIYSWRGADIRNILNFEKDFAVEEGGPKIIMLEQNYRSTKTILDASNQIIEKNKNRYDKKLFTEKKGGDKIAVFSGYDEREEAVFVAQKSMELIRSGTNPNEIAVLYRANFQSRNLEEAFLDGNIPYQVLGTRFFERREVKDVLSFIKASLNPESLADIKRIINVPPRGIGKVTLMKMFSNKEDSMTPKIREKVQDFKNLLKRIKEIALSQKTSETIKFVLRETGLEKKLQDGTDDDIERLENIKELVTLGKKYDVLESEEGITKLLEDAALATEQDSLDQKTNKNKEGVKLMTIHASKGLEFENVFITGLEEGLFPHEAHEGDENRDEEEERRLFYVALTRAKKRVFLTYANERTIYGGRVINLPSTFITDLDDELLEETTLLEDIIQLD